MLFPQSISVLALTVALGLSSSAFAADNNGERSNPKETKAAETAPAPVDTDQLIVRFKETASVEGIDRVLTQLSGQQVDRVQHVRTTEQKSDVFKWERRKSRDQLKNMTEWLKSQPEVEYAEPDLIMTTAALPTDPNFSYQWSFTDAVTGINAENAWSLSTGQGSVVAVIDTGYRPHADLVGNLLPGYDLINTLSVAADGTGRDADASDPGDYYLAGECGGTTDRNSSWHGTHVAGTIAAVANNGLGVAGLAYNAKVVPVRVLGKCGGYTSDIADGMVWAVGNAVSGTTINANPARVLNLSLGGSGSCSITTQNAINTARSKGAVVVVAAGNSNADASGFSPANCAGVITVAATARDGGRARYSNFGVNVDLAAPGGSTYTGSADGIISTLNAGTRLPDADNYVFYQGTSMATPHVAGTAALMLAANPALNPDQVESLLKASTRAFPNVCTSCGAGLLDAGNAVQQAASFDTYGAVKTDYAANKALWTTANILNYSYVLDQQMGTSTVQRYKFTVKNGVVVSGVNLANNRALSTKDLAAKGKTINQLFTVIEQAIVGAYADIRVTYAATMGYPVTIAVDPKWSVTGDQSSYKVSSFTRL